jgi:O-antigen ligase
MRRLTWFEDPTIADPAVEGRRYGARVAWNMFMDEPLIGHGPGVTSRHVVQEAPHNVYLDLMAEQGLFGLALYLGLLATLARAGLRLARTAATLHDQEIGRMMMLFAVFLAAYGFFIHNVLREPFTVFVLAFVVAVGYEAAQASASSRFYSSAGPLPVARGEANA